ncbi:hypothetical protein AMTR_s00008p00136620 [Amborella trichopoda]|uniref:Uncharacterized protein n=1 Tax=Amborella trichopoda TaxID=13333 RepID=W1NJH0_AMBTC|nr:hypothetical protein AMTR_s00008p00136620 [Amborella trichopoda]
MKTNGFLPKIEIHLSKKEIEDDLLAMGAKLPLRPKKRLAAAKKYIKDICIGNDLRHISPARYLVKEANCAQEDKGDDD